MGEIAIVIGLLGLGVVGIIYHKSRYKGGASSIVGAVMLTIGVILYIIGFEEGTINNNASIAYLLFPAVHICFGIILLISGHKIHIVRTKPSHVDKKIYEGITPKLIAIIMMMFGLFAFIIELGRFLEGEHFSVTKFVITVVYMLVGFILMRSVYNLHFEKRSSE